MLHNTFFSIKAFNSEKTVNLLILKAGICAVRLLTVAQSNFIGYWNTLFKVCKMALQPDSTSLFFVTYFTHGLLLTFYPCCTIHFGFSSTENYISSLYTDGF